VRLPYNKRIAVLKQNRIGLWDIIASCSRRGSSDSTIRNAQVNEIAVIFERFHGIKAGILQRKRVMEILREKYQGAGQSYLFTK